MKIDSYSFGKIIINGKTYTSDVIVFPDRVKANWWRKEGHEINPEDIADIIKAKPDTLIIGTGAYDLVTIKDKTREMLSSKRIRLIAKPTKEACDEYNRIRDKRKVAGLHLTC